MAEILLDQMSHLCSMRAINDSMIEGTAKAHTFFDTGLSFYHTHAVHDFSESHDERDFGVGGQRHEGTFETKGADVREHHTAKSVLWHSKTLHVNVEGIENEPDGIQDLARKKRGDELPVVFDLFNCLSLVLVSERGMTTFFLFFQTFLPRH